MKILIKGSNFKIVNFDHVTSIDQTTIGTNSQDRKTALIATTIDGKQIELYKHFHKDFILIVAKKASDKICRCDFNKLNIVDIIEIGQSIWNELENSVSGELNHTNFDTEINKLTEKYIYENPN